MNPEFERVLADTRVIVYHKQATSARTLFLVHAHGSVIVPEPLPPLAAVHGGEVPDPAEPTLAAHPASLAAALARCFGAPAEAIEIDPEFRAWVDTPGRRLSIYLGRLRAIDPPQSQFAALGARFAALTELRRQAPAELELLQRAYQSILG